MTQQKSNPLSVTYFLVCTNLLLLGLSATGAGGRVALAWHASTPAILAGALVKINLESTSRAVNPQFLALLLIPFLLFLVHTSKESK